MIWVYDKKVGSSKKLPIKVVAQESGFYDPVTEKRLSEEVEGPAHAILGALRAGSALSREDRVVFTLYMATMLMRVPHRRRRGLEMVSPALNSSVDELKVEARSLSGTSGISAERVEKFLSDVDLVHKKFLLKPPDEVVSQIKSPWPTNRVFAAIHDMTWRIIRAPAGLQFLTGDRAAFIFDGLGLATPKSELTFPIASDIALVGCWQGIRAGTIHIRAKAALVRELNRRLASGAERFVFYHECQPWVATIADKSKPYLCEIRW